MLHVSLGAAFAIIRSLLISCFSLAMTFTMLSCFACELKLDLMAATSSDPISPVLLLP